MGWNIIRKPANMKTYLDQELSAGTGRVRASAFVGATYYAAVQDQGECYALVVITEKSTGGEVAYKVMGEDEGPYAYECPSKILKLLTPTVVRFALEWRRKNGLTV